MGSSSPSRAKPSLPAGWRDNIAGQKQSKRFLESIRDNLLTQLMEDTTKRSALLDLILANKRRLIGDVKVEGSLDCSGHENGVEHPERREQGKNRITTLDFREHFSLLKGGKKDRPKKGGSNSRITSFKLKSSPP
ncbi:dtw domain-containing protein 2 [Willisornis vidua]|uniref:Dtw domain-containing protein 2 n=1 Tax=Willisornis vidua TaxID=1566151 RepID=A0ABQ9D3E9_9PASS|nr:dtw domain-containing protein 2 [Willisornis vidua]